VLHDLQLNAWALAWRRLLGGALVEWHGEVEIEPPRDLRPTTPLLVDGDWSAEDLRDPRPRLLRPDAMLEVRRDRDGAISTYLIEFDRTRRVDKNYEKFRRYDAFLNWWWRHSPLGDLDEPPVVVFICQDEDHCRQFLTAADRELTGYIGYPTVHRDRYDYAGRRRIVFAIETDMHAGAARAWHVPRFPRSRYHDDDENDGDRAASCVRLPGHRDSYAVRDAA